MTVCALLSASVTAEAQVFPNHLSADSVNPQSDSLYIAVMKARLDEIRRTQKRPTVALVLSGGGAKGAAHVGAKKLIDELGIPVDVILGTSMGGLMGGMMALGYDCDFLDSLLRHQNWKATLSDKIDPKHIPYTVKEYNNKFLVSVPFHYEDEDFSKRVREEQERSDRLRDGVEGTNSFLSSMPSGYAHGLNVNSFLSSLTVGYHDSLSFARLPIPFYCVASDMVSCKAYNWTSGPIKTALRSTMSIPGLFKPVRYSAKVLVDGGTRNNFPTDMAHAMGADIVIGVDLSDARPAYSAVNNIADLGFQFITMLGIDSFSKNRDACDVLIKPDLTGYNMLSFSPEAIDTIISRGYSAAVDKLDQLKSIKARMPDAETVLSGKPAVDISRQKVIVSDVIFPGLSEMDVKVLKKKLDIDPGESVDAVSLHSALSVLQGTGCFENITYSLLGSEEPYVLSFNCEKAPKNQFGFGFRGDTEEWPSLLLNVGINTHKLTGSTLDFNAKFGTCKYISGKYSLDLPGLPTFNAEAILGGNRTKVIYSNDVVKYNLTYMFHTERIYLSNANWRNMDFRVGLQNRYLFVLNNTEWGNKMEMAYGEESLHCDYLGAFMKFDAYNMDDMYYPTRGIRFGADYVFDFAKPGRSVYSPTHYFGADFKAVIPLGKVFALIPDVHYRGFAEMQGRESDMEFSLAHNVVIGGAYADRYLDGQVPFAGFGNMLVSGYMNAAVANLELRANVYRNIFVSALGGYLKEFTKLPAVFDSQQSPQWFGAGVEVGMRLPGGPIKVNVHWSDLTKYWQFYFSFGFDF